jgi:hypothetical protein
LCTCAPRLVMVRGVYLTVNVVACLLERHRMHQLFFRGLAVCEAESSLSCSRGITHIMAARTCHLHVRWGIRIRCAWGQLLSDNWGHGPAFVCSEVCMCARCIRQQHECKLVSAARRAGPARCCAAAVAGHTYLNESNNRPNACLT